VASVNTNIIEKIELQQKPKESSKFRNAWYTLKKNKAALVGLGIIMFLILVAIFGQFIMPYKPNAGDLSQSLQRPSFAHWFGTDEQGRDIFSRVIDGTKISLKVGVAAVTFALTVGTIVGSLAGYYGGTLDMLLMRVMDIVLAFPSLLLALALMSVLGRGIDKAIIAISIVTIPEYARIVRGTILSIKENEYVQAARVIGNSDTSIIFKHILPNAISPIIVRATLGVSTAILECAALGFLGFGVQPPQAEWGSMLSGGRSYFFNAGYMILYPGLAITITVLAFNLFGDGLRDALDPKLHQ
jgi:ABC-type dipeptide/oligopeptide/nickel transport system permease subunit